jgi:signal transduction histidine kinase
LGHFLLNIGIRANLLWQRLIPHEKAIGLEEINESAAIEKLINEAIHKTRKISRGIFPMNVDDLSLRGVFERISFDFEEFTDVEKNFDIEQNIVIDDVMTKTQLYYIAQEAIKNALKHARANRISVSFKKDGRRAVLIVADNGRGISKEKNIDAGVGLNIMKYRARIIGAVLDIESEPNKGTRVVCRFPM